jgi:hypothetical protein
MTFPSLSYLASTTNRIRFSQRSLSLFNPAGHVMQHHVIGSPLYATVPESEYNLSQRLHFQHFLPSDIQSALRQNRSAFLSCLFPSIPWYINGASISERGIYPSMRGSLSLRPVIASDILPSATECSHSGYHNLALSDACSLLFQELSLSCASS